MIYSNTFWTIEQQLLYQDTDGKVAELPWYIDNATIF